MKILFELYYNRQVMNPSNNITKILLLCAIAVAMSVVGCVPTYSILNYTSEDYSEIKPPAGSSKLDPVEVQAIIADIDERNTTVEDDPEWIKRAYNGLMVRKLNNLSEREYKG